MKKRTACVFLAVLCLFALLSLSACTSLFSDGTSSTTEKKQDIIIGLHLDESYGITQKDFIGTGNILVEPKKVPEKVGYDFVGWTSDEKGNTPLVYGKKITESMDIYPQWKLKTLTVTFSDEKKLVSEPSKTVDYGETLLSLPEPESAGYNFVGWFEDTEGEKAFDITVAITENKTLYAVWKEIKYAVTLITNGGTVEEEVKEYTMFREIVLPECNKEGYKFMGWYEKSDFSGQTVAKIAQGSSGDKTYYAKFLCTSADVAGNTQSVTVQDNQVRFSVSYAEATVDIADYLSFAFHSTYTLTQGGYACNGIYLPENEGEETKTYTYEMKVTSESGTVKKTYSVVITQYTAREAFVKFYVGDNLTDTKTVIQGGKVSEPSEEPSAEKGYRFRYWRIKDAETEFDFETAIGGDIDLEAYFEAITYTVTFCQGYAEKVDSITYTVEDEVSLPTPICKNAEYEFGGWYDKDYFLKTAKIEAGSTGNQTLYARYKLKERAVTDFYGISSITKSQLKDYLRYFYFNRLEEADIEITGATEGESFATYFSSVNAEAQAGMDGIAGCQVSYYSVTANADGVWKASDALFSVAYIEDTATMDSEDSGYEQIEPVENHIGVSDRSSLFNDFAIEHVADTLTCSDSEQLFYAVEHGFRPVVVASSVAESIYNKAKNVLRSVITNDMTDEEKALCLYEYVVLNNQYDHTTFDKVMGGEISADESQKYKCFYLEGFFDNGIAVCDGISKAFTLLCRIEGIRAVQVEGEIPEVKDEENNIIQAKSGHAWNKIFIEAGGNAGAWYVVDCTSADIQLATTVGEEVVKNELLTHSYFLISDEKMGEKYRETEEEFAFTAETNYDYFDSYTFTQGGTEYSLVIDSDAEMNAFLKTVCAFADAHSGEQVSMEIVLADGYSFTETVDGNLYLKSAVIYGVEDFTPANMTVTSSGKAMNFIYTVKKGN